MKTVVEEKTASFDVGAILSPMVDEMMVEFDPLFEEILGDALAGFPLAKLLDVIEGESELVVEALMEIIGALPLDLLLAAYENNGQDHSPPGLPADLLRDIISDLPFDVLADLLTKKDIDDLVKGLFAFTDELPLDTVAPLLGRTLTNWVTILPTPCSTVWLMASNFQNPKIHASRRSWGR